MAFLGLVVYVACIIIIVLGLAWLLLMGAQKLWRRLRRPRFSPAGRPVVYVPPAARRNDLPTLAWQTPPVTPRPSVTRREPRVEPVPKPLTNREEEEVRRPSWRP